MKLVRAYRVDGEAEKVGVTHVCWDDEFESYWPICGIPGRVHDLMLPELWTDWRSTTCKKCSRLKLSHFRRVKRAIREWENWG